MTSENKRRIIELKNCLKPRVQRAEYLRRKAVSLLRVNPEQAEAYIQRLNWQKSKILKLSEELSRLDGGLDLIA